MAGKNQHGVPFELGGPRSSGTRDPLFSFIDFFSAAQARHPGPVMPSSSVRLGTTQPWGTRTRRILRTEHTDAQHLPHSISSACSCDPGKVIVLSGPVARLLRGHEVMLGRHADVVQRGCAPVQHLRGKPRRRLLCALMSAALCRPHVMFLYHFIRLGTLPRTPISSVATRAM